MTIHTVIKDCKIESKSLIPLNDCRVIVTVNKFYPKRSLQSNKYYWVCLNQLVELTSEHTGYTKDELHQAFKEMFLNTEFTNVLTGESKSRTKSTTELSSKEFNDYLENVIKFCAEKFGIEILTPEKYYET